MALGPVKSYVKAAADAIQAQFGIKTVYGWRPADPFPDHPSGHAVDFMINDIPNGKATGDALAEYAIRNAKALGIKYLIWYRRSYNVARGTWQPYNQPGQPPHTDHVHITWNDVPGSGVVDTSVTPVGMVDDTKDKINALWSELQRLNDMTSWFTDDQKKLRVRLFMFGVMLIAFGLFKFDKVATVAKNVTGKVAGAVKNGYGK